MPTQSASVTPTPATTANLNGPDSSNRQTSSVTSDQQDPENISDNNQLSISLPTLSSTTPNNCSMPTKGPKAKSESVCSTSPVNDAEELESMTQSSSTSSTTSQKNIKKQNKRSKISKGQKSKKKDPSANSSPSVSPVPSPTPKTPKNTTPRGKKSKKQNGGGGGGGKRAKNKSTSENELEPDNMKSTTDPDLSDNEHNESLDSTLINDTNTSINTTTTTTTEPAT